MSGFGLELLAKGIEQTGQFGFDQASNAIAYGRSKKLMALQNQYAVENWRRENAYNTPAMQMARLKAAGLNPDLMYHNGAVGLQGADIGNPSPAPAVPNSNNTGNVSTLAQLALAGAQVKKLGAETEGQTLENIFRQRTLESRVESVAKQNNWTDQQVKESSERIAKLNQEIGVLVGQQNLMRIDQDIKNQDLELLKKENLIRGKDINWYEVVKQAEVEAQLAKAGCDRAMSSQITQMLPLLMTEKTLSNGLSAIEFGIQDKFAEADKWFYYVTQGLNTVSQFLPQSVLGKMFGLSQAGKPNNTVIRREHHAGGYIETRHSY